MHCILLLFCTSWLIGTTYAQQDNYSQQKELRGSGYNQSTAQRIDQTTEPTDPRLVTVLLQNNASSAKTVMLRVTEPGKPVYSVVSIILGPNAKRRETYPIGTKIEQLTSQQQQVAMKGGEATGQFIVTLKASDNGQTYALLD